MPRTAPKTYSVRVRVIPWHADAFDAGRVIVVASNSHDARAAAEAAVKRDHPAARGVVAIDQRRVQS